MKKSVISESALQVLSECKIESFEKGSLVFLPSENGMMERKLYLEVNQVLETLGGKWNKKNKAHLFPDDPTDKINDAVLTGDYVRLDKNGFFPTPGKLANEMVEMFKKNFYDCVLEPSAGNGNLIISFATKRRFNEIDGIEPSQQLLEQAIDLAELTNFGGTINWFNLTFEEYLIHNEAFPPIYDAILMNPPFENSKDAIHIQLAIGLLAPGGELVAIASAGLLFRKDRHYAELRKFLSENGGIVTQLPEGTFKESGTNVNTVLIYYKNGEKEEMTDTSEINNQTVLDAFNASESLSEQLSANGRTLILQINKGAKTFDTLNDRDKGKWNSVVKVYQENEQAGNDITQEVVSDFTERQEAPAQMDDTVWRVPIAGGAIEVNALDVALAELVRADWKEETAKEQLLQGDVIPTETHYYSVNRDKLVLFSDEANNLSDAEVESLETNNDQSDAEPQDLTYELDEIADVPALDELTEKDANDEKVDPKSDETKDAPKPIAVNTKTGDQIFVGSVVYDTDKPGFSRIGRITEKDNRARVEFTMEETGEKIHSANWTPKWQLVPAAELEKMVAEKASTALAKMDHTIDGIPVIPLSTEEQSQVQGLIAEYKNLDRLEKEEIPLAKGRILLQFKQNDSFRQGKSFDDFCKDEFDITREYGENLVQLFNYREETKEILGGSHLSVNTQNQLVRNQNKLLDALGLGEMAFNIVKPIVINSLAVLGEFVPKDDDGNPNFSQLTPRIVSNVSEVMRDIITKDLVEISGEQMTVAEAKEKGLLDTATRQMVVDQVSEGILAKREIYRSEGQKSLERQIKPITNGGTNGKPLPKETFDGVAPVLGNINCSRHGATTIISIGTGKLQTGCECRFHIDATTNKLVCFETDGQKVK